MGKLGFDVAVKVANEQNAKADGTPRKKYEYFKPEAQVKKIRFVTVDGMENSIDTYAEHFVKFKNGWSRSYSCPDADNDGPSTCVICKVRPGVEVAETNYGMKHLMQVVERNSPVLDEKNQPVMDEDGEPVKEDRLKIFKFSPFLMTTLKAYLDEYGDLGDRDYQISFIDNPDKSAKMKKIYVVTPVGTKAKPLSDETEELLEGRVKNLTEVEPTYNADDINKIINYVPREKNQGVTEETKNNIKKYLDEDDEDEIPAPKAKSKVSLLDDEEEVPLAKKKITPVVEEDDDDDTVEFFKLAKNRSK